MKKYLEAGKIVSTHALKGEVKIQPWCDSAEFLCEFDVLYFEKGRKQIEIERSRPHKNMVIAKIKGIDTPEQANTLRNKILYLDRDDVELEEGCYFIQDLIGLEVLDADDNSKVYGKLADVMETGANDVYTVRQADGKEFLIPAIPQVVIETDIDNGRMFIRPLEEIIVADDEDLKDNED